MNLDLPQTLQSTRDLLAGSLQLHATERAPAIPADLLNDLSRRFNTAPVSAASIQSRSWFEAVQSFIARPAFGMAALAIVILGISVPRMINSTSTPARRLPRLGFPHGGNPGTSASSSSSRQQDSSRPWRMWGISKAA